MTLRDSKLQAAFDANGLDILKYFERRVDADDAPDLLSEVMLVAWRRIGAMPNDTQHARMWLFGVARNVLSEHDRAGRRRSRLAARLRAETSTQRQHNAPVDQNSEVIDAVRRLPSDLRELVALVHWDGFTLTEAATHLGIRPSSARGRYQRAREQLRVALYPDHNLAPSPAP